MKNITLKIPIHYNFENGKYVGNVAGVNVKVEATTLELFQVACVKSLSFTLGANSKMENTLIPDRTVEMLNFEWVGKEEKET